MVETIQYGGSISSIRWRIFSTDVSHHQYGGVHHQYSGGYAVWTCHIINTEEGVQYMTTKTAQRKVVGCIYLGKYYLQTI